jgi:hypothetical protein
MQASQEISGTLMSKSLNKDSLKNFNFIENLTEGKRINATQLSKISVSHPGASVEIEIPINQQQV